ncbi:MAG: hypothetical protein QXY49_05055 [Thermofilaceae archaeon]
MRFEETLLKTLSWRGVLKVKELNCEERNRIKELELNYSQFTSFLGKPVNIGVEECLKRRKVFAALTSPGFNWPPGPYAVLKIGGREIGFITERGLEVRHEALKDSRGEHIVVILPLRIPELDSIVEDCIVASPSPLAHIYLLQLLEGAGLNGTLIVGFNKLRSSVS